MRRQTSWDEGLSWVSGCWAKDGNGGSRAEDDSWKGTRTFGSFGAATSLCNRSSGILSHRSGKNPSRLISSFEGPFVADPTRPSPEIYQKNLFLSSRVCLSSTTVKCENAIAVPIAELGACATRTHSFRRSWLELDPLYSAVGQDFCSGMKQYTRSLLRL